MKGQSSLIQVRQAKLGRGNVYITGPDFENPDGDCGWILYSYFPDEGKVYLLNLDYENERKCVLQQFGDKEFITLKGGEFRIVDSVKLDADEKLNNDAPVAEFFNDVKIPMRDGVKLAGDLYLPANRTGKIGCFLSFSPYNATKSDKPYVPDRGEEWGVATLAVDCRGCCHSEGVFEPWEKRLVDDADDLLKWIAAQPWSNGRVVTVGGSYPGNTQLACLKSANPALVACAPSVITFNPHSIVYAPGNILIPEFFKKWHTAMSSAKSWKELTRHSDANDPYWLERCDLGKLAEAKGRVLYQAGWFDMLGIETFESFELMPKGSFLRIGPWSHGVNTFDDPEIKYNKVAEASVTEDMEIEFLRSALEGRDSETSKLPGKMQIFVMGANVWRYENEWPLARTVYRKLYFDEGLGLSFDAPKGAAGEDSFSYDPENPVLTKGGRIILDGGQFSQAEIEARKDVLSYTTETLDEDLEVTGNVMASLVAKSTAKVADVAVKLVDVYPDGTPYNVLDSICRGTFAADAATKLDFRVDITSYVFKKGHKLRVEIAGSNSPHYEKAKEAATTRLVRGESHLVLPTIPDAEKVTERIELLTDGDIAKHWYTWLKGEGRDSDTNKVFTAEGSTLKVSGEVMGCVTTRKAYRDYRLSLEYRYVDNDVQLNKKNARDGGILFHSTGEDGVFWGVWMSSFECNIIQGATGDLIVVGDEKGKPGVYRCKGRVDPATKGKESQLWKADGEEVSLVNWGRIRRPDVSPEWKNLMSDPLSPNEKPVGEWNKVEVVCSGDRAEFYFNGMKTGEYWDLNPSSGRIQLQSEGFGIEYRNIVLEPVE